MNATETLPPAVIAFLDVIEMEADDCKEVVINNDDEMNTISIALRSIKTRMSELEDKRKEMTRPLDESKARIMDMFRPVGEKLKAAESLIKAGIVKYQRKIAEENAELQRIADEKAKKEAEARKQVEVQKAEEAVLDNKPELAVAYLNKAEEITPVKTDIAAARRPSGIGMRKEWKHRVVDDKKIPREFLVIDESKLARYAKAMKQDANVEGVEFYEEEIVSARTYNGRAR